MAVTSAEAEAAIARAEELTKAMEVAQWLTGPKLEAEIASLRQVSLYHHPALGLLKEPTLNFPCKHLISSQGDLRGILLLYA